MSSPVRECDVVMKGGIASGVVYAGAIRSLAREFRFRSLGGTSAGAIAAAVAAAAEYRRQTRGAHGFAHLLEPLVDDLTARRFFPRLLQTGRATRPVVRIGLTAVDPAHGRLAVVVHVASVVPAEDRASARVDIGVAGGDLGVGRRERLDGLGSHDDVETIEHPRDRPLRDEPRGDGTESDFA